MSPLRNVPWVATALLASCAHDSQVARGLSVSGKAYCAEGEKWTVHQPAAGKTIRLLLGKEVIAQNVVGVDGTYMLNPGESIEMTDTLYLDTGDRLTRLTNDYASWIKGEVYYRADLRISCRDKPTAAAATPQTEEVEHPPYRPPPSPNLIPTHAP